MTEPRLHPAQVRVIVRAEDAVTAASAALEQAKRERAEVRASYADLLPLGEEVELAGYRLKRALKSTGQRFSLKGYLERHGRVTAAMQPFVSGPTSYEDWQVKPLPGRGAATG